MNTRSTGTFSKLHLAEARAKRDILLEQAIEALEPHRVPFDNWQRVLKADMVCFPASSDPRLCDLVATVLDYTPPASYYQLRALLYQFAAACHDVAAMEKLSA